MFKQAYVLLWATAGLGLLVNGAAAQEKANQKEERAQPLTPEQEERWRAQIRSTLFIPDPLPRLEPEIHGRFEPASGVVAERVTYASQFGLRVPAIVYLPKERRGKVPALIVVNGHGGDKYSWYAFYAGILYARAGAVVLTFDPVGEGERHRERKSGTRAHDAKLDPREMGQRLGGLLVTDVLQAVSYLAERPEVDPRRIGAMGYSLGSFVVALTGAIDRRLHACVLTGGGNLDGPKGYWDKSKPMCQGIPYQALQFLGDRPAALYALHASRGPTLIFNGLADQVVAIPPDEGFWKDLQERTARLRGKRDGLFEFGLVPQVSHRPFFVTRPVALWLEKHLDFPNWKDDDIRALKETHIGPWARARDVSMDPLYATEEREGGTRALGTDVPGLARTDLSVFTPEQWEKRKALLIYESWVERARAAHDEAALREQAAQGLRKAVEFFRTKVAVEGGYVRRCSEDLARREGSEKRTATMVCVESPGTPSVGLAYLTAHAATGDAYYLEAARETAHALVRGQLRSGGWHNWIEFDPKLRPLFAYRVDEASANGRNVTTLDDNKTQEAVRLLLRVDQALQFKDPKIHEAAVFALDSLLKAQYPNGAWPQRYDRFPDPEKFPVKKAGYPESWSRTWPAAPYTGYYTCNDNCIADVIDVLLEAAHVYEQPKYRQAAAKAGGFLVLAQLPEPQPGWAQQYDAEMHPAWARKFEPPAVTGHEARGILRTLLVLYRETGDKKYLGPFPRALEYYRKSRLPDGRLARFYELKTNKPLYFTKDYKLTYDDNDLPTHYGFRTADWTDAVARDYERVKGLDPAVLKQPPKPPRPTVTAKLRAEVKAALAALDDQGRWTEDGRLRRHGPDDPTKRIIDCRTFLNNVEVLTRYLAAENVHTSYTIEVER